MNRMSVLIFVLCQVLLFGCQEGNFREGVIMAGGQYVSAETLNKGHQIYMEYCMPCHGVKGDGNGVAAKGLPVPPRNFTLGLIKFGDVTSGDLTHDEAVYKTLKEGLDGTAMLPWDLKPGQMEAVWQYIKTFAPKTWVGKDKKLGEKMTLGKDPFGLAHKEAAIKRGREVYHVVAQCQSCHRGYVSNTELKEMTMRLTKETADDVDEDYFKIKLQDSDHGYVTLPPDFTWHKVRSAQNINDLAIRIAAGAGGTAMPAWKDTIEDDDVWAVAYYVKHLMEMKDTPKRKKLMESLK